MIIKLRKVKEVRNSKDCTTCYKRIWAGNPAIYLFGMAEVGDKPYGVWIHPECAISLDVKRKLAELEAKK